MEILTTKINLRVLNYISSITEDRSKWSDFYLCFEAPFLFVCFNLGNVAIAVTLNYNLRSRHLRLYTIDLMIDFNQIT